MARTDGILETNVAIDSAIIGMTAMVSVNGSAFVCVFIILFYFIIIFCLFGFLIFQKKKKKKKKKKIGY